MFTWLYQKLFGAEATKEEIEKEQSTSVVTWKESANRDEGPTGYVFGDITRGVVGLFTTQTGKTETDGDLSYSQLQMLIYQAIHIYKMRGYIGSISMSHSVGYFTESCTVDVEKCSEHNVKHHKLNVASKASHLFFTLVQRLEKRAEGWDNYIDGVDLNPSLTTSAQIGFKAPIISIGWGVSISLTITKKSLLNWMDKQKNIKTLSEISES